jgi:uncharacterized membrane protein
MTWYYAAEGKQIGPFTEEQFRGLIAGGTIQPTTLVWEARLPNWLPLSQLPPEILSVPATPPGMPPFGLPPLTTPATRCANCGGTFPLENLVQIEGALICPNCKPIVLHRIKEGGGALHTPIDPDELVRHILDTGRTIEVGRCLSRAWAVMKANFGPMVGVPLLVFVVMAAGGVIPFIGSCISLAISGPLMGGLYWYLLKQIRGQAPTIGDAFSGFSKNFAQLLLGYVVPALLAYLPLLPFGIFFFARNIRRGGAGPDFTLLDGVLLVVGVVGLMYLAIAWMYSLPLIVDKGMNFWPAMQVSRRVVNHRLGPLFLLILLTIAIALAGVLACGVGLLVALPLIFTISMCAYEDLFGGAEAPAAVPVSSHG